MAKMYDAANPDNIPDVFPGELVAGYINGQYRWTDEQWARFGDGITKVTICIYIPGVTNDPYDQRYSADVLDIEAGDVGMVSKSFAITWCQVQKDARDIRPTIYTSKSGLGTLGDIDCDFWIADPDIPSTHILPGTVATQWGYAGGYDISETVDGWPGHKTGQGTTTGGGTVANAPCGGVKLTSTGKGYWLWGKDGGVFAYGDAKMMGNPTRDLPAGESIVGFDRTADDGGYVMVSDKYNLYSYGNAPFLGHP